MMYQYKNLSEQQSNSRYNKVNIKWDCKSPNVLPTKCQTEATFLTGRMFKVSTERVQYLSNNQVSDANKEET